MASTYLTCNVGSPNQQRFTWSLWVKRSKLGVEQHLAGNNVDNNNRTHLFITNTEKLYFFSNLSGSNVIAYQTNRVFRDLNAWYHIVCAVDTTQAGGNRIRIYVNGEEENSFATETECNQNTNLSISGTHYIGTYGGNAGNASYSFDGSISHLHFVDGSQLTPSSFGSTDASTGEWKINTTPSVTYGSSGYFILKDGNSVTDQSGNSNNFTVAGGTLTKTEDSPSNVFATWNPLARFNGNFNFSNGNTSVSAPSGTWNGSIATMGFNSGKWYWEAKFSGNADNQYIGVFDESANTATNNPMNRTGTTAFYNYDGGEMIKDGSATTADYGTITSSQICGVAVDADNNTISIYRDGVAIVSNYALSTTKNLLFPFISVYNTTADYNFGNGYFGTTAVSSPGTNASNNGIFEYDVPSGYTALSTKGLNL